jgi:hypothetical protein
VKLVVLLVLLDIADAHAEWRFGLGGGRIAGHEPSELIDGAAIRLGAEYRFHPAFGFGPEVSFLQLSGFRDGRPSTARGAAATYVARWYALRSNTASLYGMFGFGGVAFDAPFPRGGTRLDGTSLWGVGGSLGLGAHGWLSLEARQLHSSNGKGLVPENPAYDGLELGLHLAIDTGMPQVARPPPAMRESPVALRVTRVELFAGARADGYSTIGDDSAAIGGVHASVEARIATIAAQVDVLGGVFSGGDAASALAARVYYRDRETAIGASAGAAAIGDRRIGDSYGVFLERYEHPTLLASIGVGYERSRDLADRWFAELFLHLYPTERLLLLAGASYAEAEIKQTRADIVMHVEYAPLAVGNTTLAGYLQYGGNLLTRASAGIVVYFDRQGYAARERSRGVHHLRFK